MPAREGAAHQCGARLVGPRSGSSTRSGTDAYGNAPLAPGSSGVALCRQSRTPEYGRSCCDYAPQHERSEAFQHHRATAERHRVDGHLEPYGHGQAVPLRRCQHRHHLHARLRGPNPRSRSDSNRHELRRGCGSRCPSLPAVPAGSTVRGEGDDSWRPRGDRHRPDGRDPRGGR